MHYLDQKLSRWQRCSTIFKLRMVGMSSMMTSFLVVKSRSLLSISRSLAMIPLSVYLLMEHNSIKTRNWTLGSQYGFLTTSPHISTIRSSTSSLVPLFLGPTSPKLLTLISTTAYITSLLFSVKTMGLGFTCGTQRHPG